MGVSYIPAKQPRWNIIGTELRSYRAGGHYIRSERRACFSSCAAMCNAREVFVEARLGVISEESAQYTDAS